MFAAPHLHKKVKSPSSFPNSFFVVILLSFVLSGCKIIPTKEDAKGALNYVSSNVKKGVDSVKSGAKKIKIKAPCEKNNDTMLIVSKFPKNEVPHTLLKKPLAEGRLTSGHGCRFSPTGIPIPKKHNGVDYAAPTGTPVYAAGSGEIVRLYKSKSYGNYIRVGHENNFYTVYAHMDEFAKGLDVGSKVAKGQVIGTVGSTGRSSGPHLHHELLYGGNSLDPLFVSE